MAALAAYRRAFHGANRSGIYNSETVGVLAKQYQMVTIEKASKSADGIELCVTAACGVTHQYV